MCVLCSHQGIHPLRRLEPSESDLFKSPSRKLWETSHIQALVLTWTFLSSLPYPPYTIKSAGGEAHVQNLEHLEMVHTSTITITTTVTVTIANNSSTSWLLLLHFIQPTELYSIISLRTIGIKAKRGLGTFPRLSRWGLENLDLELRHLIPRFVFLAKTGDQ